MAVQVETIAEVTPNLKVGLTTPEVKVRIQRGQTNNFRLRVGRSYWDIFRDNVFNVFNVVLFTLLLIVLIAGDYAVVVFSGFSVVTNSLLGMVQEIHAKRKLDRMASLAAPEARVWRDGKLITIPVQQIVLDDVISVEPGDRLTVDGPVIASDSLEVDESQITGESDAVFKNPGDRLFSGSFCIAGSGLMGAEKVGAESTVNKLSAIAKAYKNVLTPTQRKIAAIVEISLLLMVIMGPMLIVGSANQGDTWLSVVRNAVVFTTSLVPQGLVLVAILSLTIGAVRISMQRTLIQRVNAVESLANVTVLCFDKTGTLTQNRLAVTEIIPVQGGAAASATSANGEAPQAMPDLLKTLNKYVRNLAYQNRTANAVAVYVAQTESYVPVKLREIPFTSARKWGAVVFDNETLVLGAPERIIADDEVLSQTYDLSTHGLRVLAFARARQPLPDAASIAAYCEPLALIVMSDQIREDIGATLDDFRQLNVQLKVISGDNLETVRAIAGQSGITSEFAYTGDQLERMNEADFENAVMDANVFARIEPDTKKRIVEALQRRQHYVAMVGDGVNDVPALKAANLAIVMNDGTQISKDVADIVLLNNAMSTLPRAFREGREITQTIFGTMKMFLSKTAYNLLMFLFVFFMMLPFPLTPIQMSWAAFGTVNMPATFIAFGIIRPKYIARFRRDVLDYVVTSGLIGAMLVALLFSIVYWSSGQDTETARSSVALFVCLYGLLIVWHVQGIEFYQPRTFIQHWQVVLVSSIATVFSMLAFYLFPVVSQFEAPGPHYAVLITVLFLLAIIVVNHAYEHRYLLSRLWLLVEREN